MGNRLPSAPFFLSILWVYLYLRFADVINFLEKFPIVLSVVLKVSMFPLQARTSSVYQFSQQKRVFLSVSSSYLIPSLNSRRLKLAKLIFLLSLHNLTFLLLTFEFFELKLILKALIIFRVLRSYQKQLWSWSRITWSIELDIIIIVVIVLPQF